MASQSMLSLGQCLWEGQDGPVFAAFSIEAFRLHREGYVHLPLREALAIASQLGQGQLREVRQFWPTAPLHGWPLCAANERQLLQLLRRCLQTGEVAFMVARGAGPTTDATAQRRKLIRQVDESLRVQGGTLTIGFHRVTHYNQMLGPIQDVQGAVERLMGDRFGISIQPKVALLGIYAHGTINATNTNPSSWNAGTGTLRKADVATFVTQIRDYITDDVVVGLFACSNGRPSHC